MKRTLLAAGLILVLTVTVSGAAAMLPQPEQIYLRSFAPGTAYRATLVLDSPLGKAKVGVLFSGGVWRYEVQSSKGKAVAVRTSEGRVFSYGPVPPRFLRTVGWMVTPPPGLLPKNYTLTIAAGEEGGRPAWKIEITPRYPGRPHRTVWVDMTSGIQLRLEDRGGDGKLLQTRVLEDLVVNPVLTPEERGQLHGEGGASQHLQPPLLKGEQLKKAAGWEPLRFTRLPKGYVYMGGRLSRREKGTVHHLYSDGLGIVSLFENPLPWWAWGMEKPQPGEVITWESKGRHLTLMGDATPEELAEMARSGY